MILDFFLNFFYQISQIIFLGLFSYFVMADLHHSKVGIVEIIVWGWALTLFVEEARQVFLLLSHPRVSITVFQLVVTYRIPLISTPAWVQC